MLGGRGREWWYNTAAPEVPTLLSELELRLLDWLLSSWLDRQPERSVDEQFMLAARLYANVERVLQGAVAEGETANG